VQRGLQYLVCVSVCVSVTQHLTFHVIICATNDTNLLSGGRRSKIKRFPLKKLRCEARVFPWVRLHYKSAIFYSMETRMRMNLDHVASGHFVLGIFASSIIGHWQ